MSAYLTNDKSSSSMTYNAISDPILTSTTNVDVAESERVRYDELTREVMNKSEPFSQLSRTHDPDQAMADQPQYLTEKIETAETNLIRQGRLTRFGVAVSELLGKGHGTRFRRLEEEESFSLARMHAETANLCKDKIKNLTGNGRVRRKSVNITCPVYTSPDIRAHAEADPPLLSRDSQELLPLATEHPDIRSEFGSLSRSFNSALEKLNLLDTEHLNDTSHKVVEVIGPNCEVFLQLTSFQNFYHTLKPSQLCPSTNIRNIKNKPHNPSQAHVSTQNDAVKETVPSNAGVDIAAHNTEVMLPSTTCGNQDSAPTVLPFSSKVEAYSHSQQPSSPLNDCSGEECDRVQSNQAGHPTVVSGLQMHPNTSEFSSAPPSTAAGSCKTPITVTDWPARPLVRSSSKCSRRNTADLAPKCTSKYGRALQEARGAMNRFLGLNKATKV